MKQVNIGLSDFKEIIDNNRYFIDKTLIVKEFIEDSSKIVLIPRPRRFGKTLNMSIVKYFFSKSPQVCEKSVENNSYLFNGLNIERENEIMKMQGTYPVIYLTFKDDKHSEYKSFIDIFKHKMSSVYLSFKYILDYIDESEKDYFTSILFRKSSVAELEISLLKLSEFLYKYHKKKVIILIDEYDTPIHQGYFKNYYDEIVAFMRNFLSSALKDNINLEKAMITGILRVARESIFSGMNNLAVYSLLNYRYSDKFGFTEEETVELLKYYSLDAKIDDFKNWYNGYNFGETTIYNPWSVLSYINEPKREFMPYWVNTADDKIIRTLLAKGNDEVKIGLESLYNGEYIETAINEDTIMAEIDYNKNNIWSFLLLSGYLKTVSKKQEDDVIVYKLAIPNKEIKFMYGNMIKNWFAEGRIDSQYNNMIKSLTLGDIKNFKKLFKRCIMESFSYFDAKGQDPENVYHAFVLGMLVSLNGIYEVRSNRESGIGRYDVCLIPKDTSKLGVIFEFKRYDKEDEESIEEIMDEALDQIEKMKYDTKLKAKGVENIAKLGVVFNKKEVHIKQG
ncbi:MAG: AAA family ATPase [Clostridium sp.]